MHHAAVLTAGDGIGCMGSWWIAGLLSPEGRRGGTGGPAMPGRPSMRRLGVYLFQNRVEPSGPADGKPQEPASELGAELRDLTGAWGLRCERSFESKSC